MHDWLNQLKGARLSAFIALALNESQICLELATPLSLHAIAAQTQMSSRHALRAIQDLIDQDYVTPVSERGPHREKLYRVSERARSNWVTVTVPAPLPKGQAPCDKRARVPAPRKRSNAKGDKVSRSAKKKGRVPSPKSEIDPDTLSEATTAASRQRSQVKSDTPTPMSRSAPALPPISSTKPNIDRDHLSGSTPVRVPSAPCQLTAGRDQFPTSTTALVPISSPKSPIPPDTHTRSRTRTHTHRRTRARARGVVVNTTTTNSLLKHEPKLLLLQQQQAHFEASRAVFAAVKIAGHPLNRLARTVDVELARAWTDRLGEAPESFTDPVGYLVKHLLDDPTEAPPEAWVKPSRPTWYGEEEARYVHGRPEHARYCREHPEEVDCICGKDWCEETGQWVDPG